MITSSGPLAGTLGRNTHRETIRMADHAASTFAALLRRYRRMAGISQEELAERAQLSIRAVSDLERGVRQAPHEDSVQRLAGALDLSVEDRRAMIASVSRRRRPRFVSQAVAAPPLLPAEVTPLVGREREEAAAVHLLHSPDVRLLTLIGPGGVGKTRLALRVAETLWEEYADGVYFVPLATVSPSLLPRAIAAALGIRDDGDLTREESVVARLRECETLLVLDNFEHLAGAAIFVSRLLRGCPKLTVLVTSRVALHLRGEHLLDVPPLKIPEPSEDLMADAELRYSAIALFVQCARAMRADFALTDNTEVSVAAICRRLDGLPLAIELAAVQIRSMTPDMLLDRLKRGVDLLPSGPIDLEPRQQTMRNTIAWSYDLLTEDEQAFFRQLSVFVGGCTVEAADAVAGDLKVNALALLTALQDRSLLLRQSDDSARPRFGMLETIREHAMELAAAGDDQPAIRYRHAEYFLGLAMQGETAFRGPEQPHWSDLLIADRDNLQAALQWFAGSDRLERALLLTGAIYDYWITWGYVREGRAWLERLLELADGMEPAVRVPPNALTGAARLAGIQCDHARAAELYQRAVDAYRQDGNPRLLAMALNNQGTNAHLLRKYELAVTYYREGLEVARGIGDVFGMAMPLSNLGLIAAQQGDYGEADALLDEAILLWREQGNQQKLAITLANRAGLAFRQGAYDDAVALHEEALAMKRAIGDTMATAHSLGDLGWAEIERGNHARAQAALEEALLIFGEAGQRDGIAECFEGMGRIAQHRDDAHRAARMYGAAARLREELGAAHHPADLPRHESALAAIRAALGVDNFQAAWMAGRVMSLDDAVSYTLAREKVGFESGCSR